MLVYKREKLYCSYIFLFFKKNLVLNCKEALKRFFFSNSMQILKNEKLIV